MLDNAKHTASTRPHTLDHADHTDHTDHEDHADHADQESTCPM